MRLDGWEQLLDDEVERAARRAFGFGHGPEEHDCCSFAARCVDAITGSDFAEQLRGAYADEQGALAFIEAEGGIPAAVSRIMSLEPRTGWVHARRGDVCLVPTERGPGLAVCIGAGLAVASDGLENYPLEKALMVWRVD